MMIPRFKSTDEELTNTEDYKKVHSVIMHLWQGGIIQRGRGYCLSMSDMIKTLLDQDGIACRLVECKLTVLGIDPPGILLVGHDGLNKAQQDINDIDSHMVCVTETKIPMLIDLSIIGVRPEVPYILERASDKSDGETLAEYDFVDSKWIYQTKPTTRIPRQHQKSIVDRIQTDNNIFKRFKILTTLIVIALIISSMNAVRGAYDFYQVYFNKDNNWGPAQMRELVEKVDLLEKLVRKPQDQRN